MSLIKFNYCVKEQSDKWIETACPLMILCVALFLILPSSILMTIGVHNLVADNSILKIVLSIIPSQLVFIVPVLLVAGFSSKNLSLSLKLGLIKWNPFYIIEAIVWEALLILPLIALAAIVYAVFLRLGYDFTSPVIELLTKTSNYGIGIVFVFAVFIAPVVEEIAFRRVLFIFMTRMFGIFSSTVLTSLVFAFIHGGIVQVLPLFILSMVLQYLYLKHGTLFPSILLHFANNLVVMILFLILKV